MPGVMGTSWSPDRDRELALSSIQRRVDSVF